MREIIARVVCLLTVGLVVALSFVFAAQQNPAAPAGAATSPGADHDRGRSVFAKQSCSTCHSIAGAGNPRSPLDGVGARWEPAELRAWITGTGIAADLLPPAIAKRKQRYQSIPEDDLKALIAYLSSLKAPK